MSHYIESLISCELGSNTLGVSVSKDKRGVYVSNTSNKTSVLRVNDIIQSIGKVPIKEIDEFTTAIQSSMGKNKLIIVKRIELIQELIQTRDQHKAQSCTVKNDESSKCSYKEVIVQVPPGELGVTVREDKRGVYKSVDRGSKDVVLTTVDNESSSLVTQNIRPLGNLPMQLCSPIRESSNFKPLQLPPKFPSQPLPFPTPTNIQLQQKTRTNVRSPTDVSQHEDCSPQYQAKSVPYFDTGRKSSFDTSHWFRHLDVNDSLSSLNNPDILDTYIENTSATTTNNGPTIQHHETTLSATADVSNTDEELSESSDEEVENRTGRWTREENELYLQAMEEHGKEKMKLKDWCTIASVVKSQTAGQCQSRHVVKKRAIKMRRDPDDRRRRFREWRTPVDDKFTIDLLNDTFTMETFKMIDSFYPIDQTGFDTVKHWMPYILHFSNVGPWNLHMNRILFATEIPADIRLRYLVHMRDLTDEELTLYAAQYVTPSCFYGLDHHISNRILPFRKFLGSGPIYKCFVYMMLNPDVFEGIRNQVPFKILEPIMSNNTKRSGTLLGKNIDPDVAMIPDRCWELTLDLEKDLVSLKQVDLPKSPNATECKKRKCEFTFDPSVWDIPVDSFVNQEYVSDDDENQEYDNDYESPHDDESFDQIHDSETLLNIEEPKIPLEPICEEDETALVFQSSLLDTELDSVSSERKLSLLNIEEPKIPLEPICEEHETALVFPSSLLDTELDSVSSNLIEPNGKLGQNHESMFTDLAITANVSHGKKNFHTIKIQGKDYDKLEQGKYLNDTLIDFWINWLIYRMGNVSDQVHVFPSQFYTELEQKGVESVTSWTANRNIDIFEKKYVFVPVNKDIHWSLLVIVNPGKIVSDDKKEAWDQHLEHPYVLFMDSLRAHNKSKLQKTLYTWLNAEAARLHKFDRKDPYTHLACPVEHAHVLRQDNGWDCGVFVCRYVFAMLHLFDTRIECKLQDWRNATFRKDIIKKYITETDAFNFGMDDITRLRDEMAILIQDLHRVYKQKSIQDTQCSIPEENEGDEIEIVVNSLNSPNVIGNIALNPFEEIPLPPPENEMEPGSNVDEIDLDFDTLFQNFDDLDDLLGIDISHLNGGTCHGPSLITLATPQDADNLSSIHCFVRKNIEVFEATEEDIFVPCSGRKALLVLGQVGLRCIHCKAVPPPLRTRRAACYPRSISQVYKCVRNMTYDHFPNCDFLPINVKKEFERLKGGAKGSSYTSKFYCDSAVKLGMQDEGKYVTLNGNIPADTIGESSHPKEECKQNRDLSTNRNFPYKDFIEKNQGDNIQLWLDEEEQSRLEKHFNPKWQVEFFSKFYSDEQLEIPDI
ncbi:hypothetical protein CTEN210_10397 [Chaetoceros tenuissimus]|uniref:Ubiquitin-like protease family profile domain-containing protein n=1 Tax=Chaetoceros tenuissimus TaxID=426638 RepID=A0AAD3CXA3_9STRA|nr:hypothetical protein CTEN210_10397 [Chaetoceros tenuissimus]